MDYSKLKEIFQDLKRTSPNEDLPMDRVHGYCMLLERHINARQPKKRGSAP